MLFDLSMFKTRLFTGAIVSTIFMSTGLFLQLYLLYDYNEYTPKEGNQSFY